MKYQISLFDDGDNEMKFESDGVSYKDGSIRAGSHRINKTR